MSAKRNFNLSIVVILGVLLLCRFVLADELRVPTEYDTIQEAIDDANDSDVVVVADGTYTGLDNKDLDFGGRAITVRSENGPEFTTIDCENDGSAFYFHRGEDANSVVDGFTIINGDTGGIVCSVSGPTIINCILSGNSRDSGGGIHCWKSSAVVTECIFIGNSARTWGGGLCSASSSLDISNCIFIGNSVVGNSGDGGGMLVRGDLGSRITNCLFVGNEAKDGGGGGLRNAYSSSPSVINCTFSGNSAHGGGAICNGPYCSPTIVNCILWGNEAVKGDEVINDADSHPEFSYCDIAGGWDGSKVVNGDGSAVINGGGNINADPLFVDATDPNIYARDYRLSAESPCIDAGTDAGVYTDIKGNPRPFDFPDIDNNGDLPEFDIGAYEAVPIPYEMAVACIEDTIAGKAEVLEKIEATLDKEVTARQFLDELLANGEVGDLTRPDVLKAIADICNSMVHEQRSKADVAKSIRKLENALDALGYEVESSALPDDGQQAALLRADLNADGVIDQRDFALFASHWLESYQIEW